jgi:hypothetical protein
LCPDKNQSQLEIHAFMALFLQFHYVPFEVLASRVDRVAPSLMDVIQLKEAQVKLSEAESLLQQIRKRSPPKKDKCEEKVASRGVTTKFPLESNSTVPKESNGAVAKSTWTSSHSSPLKKTWVADEGRTSASVRFNKTERSIASSSHGVAEQHSKLPASSQTYSGRIQDMKPSDKLSGQKKFKVVVPQREHMDLIVNIRSQKKAKKLDVGLPSYIPIQHKRKPRSLVLSPATDHLCATRYSWLFL